MAATTKAELLAVSCAEWAKLEAVPDRVPEGLALVKDAEDTSIKDVVAHRAHWIGLFFCWYKAGQAGVPVAVPAPGYKWNDLRRYNADLRAAQAGLDWSGARAQLKAHAAQLWRFREGQSDVALYSAAMPGGGSKWTTARWAEAAGPSHYRSASKYIKTRLKAG